MSVRGRNPARASSAFFVVMQLVTVLLVAGCSDGLFSPNTSGRGQLQLRPVFSSVDWQSVTASINVIRLTAVQLPARSIVLREETTVDPTAAEWQLPADVPVDSELEVLVELISRTGSVDVIVYSGRMLVNVKAGGQPLSAMIPVFPGPPDNLDITSLTLTPENQSLLEGDQVQLTPTVVGSANPTIVWSSSNTNVATVDGNGVVRTVGLGLATIEAVAGPKSDNVTIDVGARAAAIQLTPTDPTLASVGAEVVFNGRVFDARNAQLNLPVTYQIDDPNVALQVAPGRFRALQSGEANVTALVVQGGQTFTASTTLKVQQTAVVLSINPPTRNFDALGEMETFTAGARDAQGNAIPNTALTWTSSNVSVATVDFAGRVTAIGNGTTDIRVQSGALNAEATVTVRQVATRITLAPSDVVLNVDETAQLNASGFDKRNNTMPVQMAWSVEPDPTTAFVSPEGMVTALKKGQAVVRARLGNLTATANLTVNQPASQIVLSPTLIEVNVGTQTQLNAFLAKPDGTPVSGRITYSSVNAAIATVSSNGTVTAVASGQTDIVAKGQGFQASMRIIVR